MIYRVIILCAALFLFSCKNSDKSTSEVDEIATLESAYKANPTLDNFNLLLQKMGEKIMTESDPTQKEALIIKSIDLCKETKNEAYINTFAIELIKLNPKSETSKRYMYLIADDMGASGKYEVASILLKGYANLYPDDIKSKTIIDSLPSTYNDLHGFIKSVAAKVFENPDVNGINKANAEKYVDVCESFALAFPNDSLAASYLFKAAEMSRAMQSYGKTISLYDWISTYYSEDKNAPMALFLKGFLLENDLKKPEKAKEIYESFIQKYPNHVMAKDVNFLIENLGKSDKEIIEKIDKTSEDPAKK